MGVLLLLGGMIWAFWRAIYIFKHGKAWRWEVLPPIFGLLGASIMGSKEVHGNSARVAGIWNILLGIFCLIALISVATRS